MLNGHRRGLASVQRVNGDIFVQFALVGARMEEMRPLLNGGPVKSNFPNYGDGAMCQLPRQTCQPIGLWRRKVLTL